MRTSLRRVFNEKRRLMIPVVVGLALIRSVRRLRVSAQRTGSAAPSRVHRLPRQARQAANGMREQRAGPPTSANEPTPHCRNFTRNSAVDFAQAQQTMVLRLTQVAEQHNLQPSRRDTARDTDKEGSLVRMRASMSLKGNYEDIRRFIYPFESGTTSS